MSESEVSQIRDEDVLRRMWQQTEDFGRKKEIRAHMYKLREERLRDLYSPEPALQGKGCEFSSAHAQRHGQSFADQSFQSMKSKEVRDASSPSKEFSYRGQELKDLSNAGWNVSAEERTADGGRTHINTVNADIEGQYSVEGGRGRFAAADRQRSALTEHQDERGSLRRREAAADSAAHDHVERVAADGTRISTTTSSSNTSSKVEQVSSTTHRAPIEDYDRNTNRGERVTRLAADDHESTRAGHPAPRTEAGGAELVSRKVEYPDDSTRVVVETRVLPDGTRVTSTRREFRAPAQSTRSEYHSTHSSSSHADRRETSTARLATRTRSDDIVDSQRHVDDQDFKRQLREYTTRDDADYASRRRVTDTGSEVIDRSRTNDDYTQSRHETRVNSKIVDHHQSTTERTDRTSERRVVDRDHSTAERDDRSQTEHHIVDRRNDYVSTTDDNDTTVTRDRDVQRKVIQETRYVNDSEEKIKNVSRERKDEEVIIQTSKSRMVPATGDREIPKDRTIPIDKPLNIPRDSTPTTAKFRDVSQERPITTDTPREAPRKETVPDERFYDAPRDQTTPRDRPSDIPVERVDKVHYVKNDTKTEEVIERKTSSDHYQTTYQNDFQSRKVSTDWSPTHQAWASTLRSDTPSTTRPSTRASSPGSKTFKSSTSSLRSSVSPDKTHRKPTSRGGSPNKVDRYSPTRTVISDRHSSTHSTHSVTEERITKNTSPERKPPTGRSPTRPGYSPDRKPQDNYRQRPSTSPDKKPKQISDRPNSSPERKLVDGRPKTTLPTDNKKVSPMEPRQSPERRPTKPTSHPSDQFSSTTFPRTSPYRSTNSPDRKIVDHFDRPSPRSSVSPDRRPKPNQSQKPTDSIVSEFQKTTSPSKPQYRPDTTPEKPSPDRKTGTEYPSGQPKPKSENNTPDYKEVSKTKRPSSSPERKPGYMRPTAASQPDENTKRLSRPEHDQPMFPNLKKDNTKIKEDHYRFVDEETKVYTFTDRIQKDNNVKTITDDESTLRDASLSHLSHLPSEDSTDYCKVPKHRESPTKNTVIVTENDELYGIIDKTVETNNVTIKRDKQTDKNTIPTGITKNKEVTGEKNAPNRATSPVKNGTYDKKKQKVDDTENITITSVNAKNISKTDSLIHRDTVSPKKHPESPISPTKKSPRDSVSPVKSSTKDEKHKYTTDFISTERNTEVENKKTTTKDRPRQLVTPSSSPTRKPKLPETEPSTGQSSPTTSVSGFVYFGSPRTDKPIVTDLDEFYPGSEIPDETFKRPETLDVKRSPSPSKIPCRSPSPEKQIQTTKDSLPRKSSLKKPSSDLNQASPLEKPPTSFCVTPTQDGPDELDHKVVKKDRPNETVKGEPEMVEPKLSEKPKPPLQRRETYDDRCKKILGLVDDTTIETRVRETKKHTRKPNSTQTSPSVSPCDSPTLAEPLPFSSYPSSKTTTKTDVTDFMAHERENLTETTTITDLQKTKILSRDSSPTKLQDLTRKTSLVTDKTTRSLVEDVVGKSTKLTSPRQSPEKNVPQDSNIKYPDQVGMPLPSNLTEKMPNRPDLSPERQSVHTYTKGTSPSRKSPEKIPSNKSINTTITSITDNSTSDIKDSTKITKISQETRILKSPTRETSKTNKSITDHNSYPRSSSPSKQKPKDGLSSRVIPSPERTVESDFPEYSGTKSEPSHDTHSRESTEKIPGYMKTTTATTSKYDTRLTSEEITETHKTRTQEKETTKSKTPSSSPTRHSPRNRTPSLVEQPGVIKTKSDTSPQRKPAQASSTKQPDADQKTPGYMKTTMTSTTKFDKTTVSQDIQETTSAKTSVEKKIISGSVSPIRKPIQPKSSERSHSPTKPNRPSEISIDKISTDSQPSSPVKESPTKKPEQKRPTSSTQSAPQKVPGYMKTTTSTTLKYDTSEYDDVITEEGFEEQITATITNRDHSRVTQSPSRRTPKPTDRSSPERLHATSPLTPSTYEIHRRLDSPERKQGYPQKNQLTEKPSRDCPINKSPTRDGAPDYMKTTTSKVTKFEAISTAEDVEVNNTFEHVQQKLSSESPANERFEGHRPRTVSPSKPSDNSSKTPASILERKPNPTSTVNDSESSGPGTKYTPVRTSESPERPSYMKPTASITSKFDSNVTTCDTDETYVLNVDTTKKILPKKPSQSPSKESPERTPKEISDYLSKPEEPRQLRTPSPTKKTTTITQANTDFIMSEREQEILNKVQKSLRKLSPERKEKSPIREKSPTKSTTSLQDLDIVQSEINDTNKSEHGKIIESVEQQSTITTKVPRPIHLKEDKPKDQKSFTKPISRNVSPIKRVPSTANKVDKTPESPTKGRSFSPKKPISNVDRPQSPQLPKSSGIKPRERVPFTRKPTPATLSTTGIERLATDVKKSNVTTKQNMFIKTNHSNRSIPSPTNKVNETDIKRTTTHKKDNLSPRKDTVIRTASDTAMKLKKPSSPQRMKSKPEIQVSDMSTKTPKSHKLNMKEPHLKLPSKPKSATSLNTSIDDDDIIIDVQQSKSSRENSPDRICPTPINFSDDVGVPRFPDEVSEPDDELIKRTHHTIHETESVVDDIVEICEDEELFVKKLDMEDIYEQDDSFLSVNDKVNKFTSKINVAKKPKDATLIFKDTERKVHSDFVDDELKSDECLLTVSEKVNKFAKGPRDTKDSRSPSRKITDEYDKDTVYTDDYTKLSVNDKAHLFVETAENVRTTKVKPAQKVERPDLSEVDESLRSDDCLLSVSDKVNKFVKTAEQSISESQNTEETETKIKQQHEKIVKETVDHNGKENHKTNEIVLSEETYTIIERPIEHTESNLNPRTQEYKPSQPKVREYGSASLKTVDRVPAVKITTLRSSEAVKKAKALFENIASTQKTSRKETTTHVSKTTKLTDIGVTKTTPKTVASTVPQTPVENVTQNVDLEVDDVSYTEHPSRNSVAKPQYSHTDEKPRSSPSRLMTQSPEVPRSKSPTRQSVEVTATKTVLSRYPAGTRAESPRHRPESPKPRTESPRHRPESPKPRTESPRPRTDSPRHRPDSDKLDKVPGYLRPTKTSQIKEETKVEETEVSSRRGSGKFGVELRRTSVERSTVSSERRRSIEHHQPCIEDIFDLDLLEQMLEKVVGYEQRRRIRAQIRIAKMQSEQAETATHTKTVKHTTTTPKAEPKKSPERKVTKSPERTPKSTPQRTSSPDSYSKPTSQKTVPNRSQPKEQAINGHAKDPTKITPLNRQRPQSPEKPAPKSSLGPKTPVRQPSPDKRRTTSPNKATPKPKGNRFNEYASAYMKKVGLSDSDKIKFTESKNKKITNSKQTVKHESQQQTVQEFTTTKSFSDRTSSKDVIEIVQTNGKRSPSPEQRRSLERKVQFPERKLDSPDHKAYSPDRKITNNERKPQSPERKPQSPERKMHSPEREEHSPERLHQRTPSPDFKRPKTEAVKETIIKTVYDIEKKIPSKPPQDDKPSWVTNRNLKKTTSESRTFSSKKIENEKPKYRAPSPSKVISKPIDVITSSYGPGPLDADGKPLFGIKALRNGGSNFQVKGTVVRQEFHSRNGGAPEGSVSVTAYSSQPEDLAQLLAAQGEPPSRLRGLAAITTTKKFGGDSGNTLANAHTKEDRASLEQFTHHDRRVEHLETSYDTRTEEFGDFSIEDISDNTRIEDITENTRKTDSKKETRRDITERRKEEKVTDTKRQKVEERREKMERREDKKTVRQSSVKSLTEKFIKSANDTGKADRSAYPKAGLILRSAGAARDSVSSDDALPGLQRTDSEHSVCSVDDTVETSTERVAGGVRTTTRTTRHHHHTTTHHEPVRTTTKTVISHEPVITTRKTMIVTQEPVVTSKRTTIVTQEPVLHRGSPGRQGAATGSERSFLDSTTKVTGVQDILTRMKNADIVVQEGDTTEDAEARALLNKFLGATVLMAGMQGYVQDPPTAPALHQETVITSGGRKVSRQSVEEIDLDQCWDERLLKKLLEECTEYEQRRKLRARIRTLMAEQEACASAVSEALGACSAADGAGAGGDGDTREEEEVIVTSSVRRDSSDKTVSSSTTTKTSKVIEMTRSAPKPVSPFAKFRQLEKQNSTNSPNSPKTPQSPGSPSQPYFKFTDPALQSSALTIKERLLQWCRDKTRDYENVKLENFSTSWADGLAFCALVHHFLPTAFDYSKLTPERRRHNFTLAFKVADEKAGIYPLLDVDDMVAMRKPDWKCVFTYVQAIYRRFKDEP